jgi:membrane-associated phospholipid phosphatase
MACTRVARVAALTAAAGAIAVLSSTRLGGAADTRLFGLVNRHRGPRIDLVFGTVTELGSLYASLAAAGTIAATGRRREAARALGAALAMWVAGQGLKKLVLRARPYDASPAVHGLRLLIARPRGTSWPSSHPGVLLAFAHTATHELGVGPAGRSAAVAVAVLVAASRVALGVHYPSDVAGGLLLGEAVSATFRR